MATEICFPSFFVNRWGEVMREYLPRDAQDQKPGQDTYWQGQVPVRPSGGFGVLEGTMDTEIVITEKFHSELPTSGAGL